MVAKPDTLSGFVLYYHYSITWCCFFFKTNHSFLSTVIKSNMRHQTTSPITKVGPTASLRDAEPDFLGPIENVTVALGREAVLTCSVSDLGDYKVSTSYTYNVVR